VPTSRPGLNFLVEFEMDEVQVSFSSAEGEILDVEGIQRQLETQFFGIGDKLLYLPTVTSTNTLAMQLAHERPEEGVVVLTDSQTAGKGRQGRRWVDVPGCNVLSSTLLRPLFPPHLLVMIASLAVVTQSLRSVDLRQPLNGPTMCSLETAKLPVYLLKRAMISMANWLLSWV